MRIGYSLSDVVRMTTVNAAKGIGLADQAGALAVGREADVTIFDVVERQVEVHRHASSPVHRRQARSSRSRPSAHGELYSPDWGPYPWGWLPEEA